MTEPTPEQRREQQRGYFEGDLRTYVANVSGTFQAPELMNDTYYYQVDVPAQSGANLKWFLEQRFYVYRGRDPGILPDSGEFTMIPSESKVSFLIAGKF